MKTIKVIELLNRIYKNEAIPKRVMFMGWIADYDEEIGDYIYLDTICVLEFLFGTENTLDVLNYKLDILKEDE